MYNRILLVAGFHSIFSTFGEHENSVMPSVGPALTSMFNQSLQRYGFEANRSQLNNLRSLIAASNYLGLFAGAYLIKNMDIRGRKFTSVILRGILGLVASSSAILSYFWNSAELFAMSHFISGINMSLKVCMIVYIAECSPSHLQGPISLLLSVGNFVMALVSQPLVWPNVFGNEQKWFLIPVVALFLCIVHLSVAFFFPESPKHLFLNCQDKRAAAQSLKFYHGRNVDTTEIFAHYEKEKELVGTEHMTLKQVWQNKTTRTSLIIVTIAGLVPACSALQIKGQFFQQILLDVGFPTENAAFYMSTIVLATTPFSFLSLYLIDKIGRRSLFLSIAFLCNLEWILLTMSKLLPSAFVGFAGLTSGHLGFKLGLLALPPIILNELCPFASKATVTEFFQNCQTLVAMIVALTYLPLENMFGATYNFTFVLINIVLFCVLYKKLPETKAKNKIYVASKSYGTIDNEI